MTVSTYSDTIGLPAGLGLSTPLRRRRGFVASLSRTILRVRVGLAMSAVRADLKSMPTFVLIDTAIVGHIGVPADEIGRIVRAARLLIVRRAIRARLDRTRQKGGRRWIS